MPGILFLGPLLVVVIVVLGLVLWSMGRYQRRTEEIVHEVEAEDVAALRYRVPTGQDPAAVVAALTHEGYSAVRDTRGADADILVPCPAGVDRERAHVRAVIAHAAAADMEGHPMPEHEVHFVDEQQAG